MGRVKDALITCPDCDGERGYEHPVGPGRERGLGIEPDWEWEDCPRCHGTGQVLDPAAIEAELARPMNHPDIDLIADTHAAIQAAREEELARLATLASQAPRRPQAPESKRTPAAATARGQEGTPDGTAHR